jgi:phosphatidate cytidylyltransferase
MPPVNAALAAPGNRFNGRLARAVLKTRVLTAIVIVAAAFCLIFLTPDWGFRLAVALLLMVGSWEFSRLASLGSYARWALLLIQAILIGLMMRYWHSVAGHAHAFLAAACLSWCVMFLRLVTFRAGSQAGLNYRLVSFFCALAAISFAWYALCWLRGLDQGVFKILLLLFIIWSADTGAYFAGRLFGRHKLAPAISPGKTREGLLGGVLSAVLVALLVAHLTLGLPAAVTPFILVTVITVLVSAAGDLFISLHKRNVGLKDSGRLFPGHGGVLDRFDSLLAGAPFFAMGLLILGS